MDKGFERCCDLIARMIEKYGDKVLQDFWKEKEVSLEYGEVETDKKKKRYIAFCKLVYKPKKVYYKG